MEHQSSLKRKYALVPGGLSRIPLKPGRVVSAPTGQKAVTPRTQMRQASGPMTPDQLGKQATPPSTMTRLTAQFSSLNISSPAPREKGSPVKDSKQAIRQEKRTSVRMKPLQDDSPVLTRLTRSTTASNLKIKSQRVLSETNIPKPVTKRVVSDIARPTRASQLKKDASLMNLRLSPKVPAAKLQTKTDTSGLLGDTVTVKKRTMAKSFSVNASLKDLTNSSIPQRRPPREKIRKTSDAKTVIRRVSAMTPKNSKCSSAQELKSLLQTYHRTEKFLQQWGTPPTNPVTFLDPQQVITTHNLNAFETAEISKQGQVYYLGNVGARYTSSNYNYNFGFDDNDKNLRVECHDHIGYRFEVLSKLGTGAFGNVYRCRDHKTGVIVSLKIMRNDPTWSIQSMYEIKILRQLKGAQHLLQYDGFFNFRSHICVTAELLSVNLLEALGATKYQGFDHKIIKLWSKQLLSALAFLHGLDIIHADLKPENIMLVSPNSLDLKIIDFGSSTTVGDVTYPYIQSRFYRAPEVLLGARYDTAIDIWSFAAVIYEMNTGRAMFEAKNELDLYRLFVKLLGHPSGRCVLMMRDDVFSRGSVNKYNEAKFVDKNTLLFAKFNRMGTYRGDPLETPRASPFHRRLDVDEQFGDFLNTMFVWSYKERPGAASLMQHAYLRSS